MAFRKIAIIFTVLASLLPAVPASAQKLDRGLALSDMPAFTQKGKWMVGGTANWSFHDNDNYRFLIANGLTSTGYKLTVSPAFCYMIKDNMGAGVRIGYQRSMLKIDDANVGINDISMDIKDYHTLRHKYVIQALLRNYIPIGTSRKIALYNEMQLGCKFGNGKVAMANGETYDGSYEDFQTVGLDFCPGIVAFANDHWAVDVNVNMLGLDFGQADQTHNQVKDGNRSVTNINFKINILAIGFGLYYYL
jgi:hypothetical protein